MFELGMNGYYVITFIRQHHELSSLQGINTDRGVFPTQTSPSGLSDVAGGINK
jgi:hypothetical protein